MCAFETKVIWNLINSHFTDILESIYPYFHKVGWIWGGCLTPRYCFVWAKPPLMPGVLNRGIHGRPHPLAAWRVCSLGPLKEVSPLANSSSCSWAVFVTKPHALRSDGVAGRHQGVCYHIGKPNEDRRCHELCFTALAWTGSLFRVMVTALERSKRLWLISFCLMFDNCQPS